ncbi:hypothetical protein TNCV_1934061 [Trichonephila clavipes]|uniref:Uncharacterized protein n=1 Tax=Trichonephila clavipes TaxID=2585209 RepID=A0A8X6RC49_TRICX|nr:hypothetical protein TNCV_1934061 [Trichonephila clavipes]
MSEGRFDLGTFRSERTNEASTLPITPKRSSSRDVGTSSYRYHTTTYTPASVSANRRTNDTIFVASIIVHRKKKRKHIHSFQSLNDIIHWSPSTINVPSGEKTETHQLSPILERCHPLSPSTINVPSEEKTETHQFSPILERCHPLKSFNYTRARPSCGPDRIVHRKKKRKHINSFQSLNDVIHWSPSTINVPSGEKTETHQLSPILERCHPLSPSTINVPSGEKTETHQFSPILERCHPLESFNYTRARPSCGPDRW